MTRDTDRALADLEPVLHSVIRNLRTKGVLLPHVEHDDAMQTARIAAWQALDTHDPAKTYTLEEWVGWRATTAVIDYQRSHDVSHARGWTRHLGQTATIVSLNHPVQVQDEAATLADVIADPEDVADHAEHRAQLRDIVSRRYTGTKRLAHIGLVRDWPQEQTARMAGVHFSQISRLTRRIREDLAEAA
jgi:RNA polymerase sigma factor (sigma-70 family)